MQKTDTVALITGANRGLGKTFAETLVRQGAKKVYAATRHPDSIHSRGVEPLTLDITAPDSVSAAAEAASDTNLLINNAGITTFSRLLDGDLNDIQREMSTNYYGTLAMARAFAPHLARNGGGAILNVLSAVAWVGHDHSNSYGASKAAAWGLTNGLRIELAEQGTQVSGLVLATTDTDMMADFDLPKNRPQDVVNTALDGVFSGQLEILADDSSTFLKSALAQDPADLHPNVARVTEPQAVRSQRPA